MGRSVASSASLGPLSIRPPPVLLVQMPSMGCLDGELGCGSQALLPHSSCYTVVHVLDTPLSSRTDLRHHPAVMMVSSAQAGVGGPWPLSYGPLRGRGLGAGKTTWTGLKLRGLVSGLREGHCPGSWAPQQIPRVSGARGTLSEAQNTPLPREPVCRAARGGARGQHSPALRWHKALRPQPVNQPHSFGGLLGVGTPVRLLPLLGGGPVRGAKMSSRPAPAGWSLSCPLVSPSWS